MEIPFLSLKAINKKYEDFLKVAFEKFLNSGFYMLGKSVKTFETNFAQYFDYKM